MYIYVLCYMIYDYNDLPAISLWLWPPYIIRSWDSGEVFQLCESEVDPQKGGFSCPVHIISLTQGSEMFLVSSQPWFIRTLVLLGGLLVNSNGGFLARFPFNEPGLLHCPSVPKSGQAPTSVRLLLWHWAYRIPS